MTSEICHIELELGREPQHPFGERGRLYHLYLPLRPDGHVDAAALASTEGCCRGKRFRAGFDADQANLRQGPAGDLVLEFDDSPARRSIMKLNSAPLVVGETVPVAEPDGQTHDFQVISVRHVRPAPISR